MREAKDRENWKQIKRLRKKFENEVRWHLRERGIEGIEEVMTVARTEAKDRENWKQIRRLRKKRISL